MSQAFEQFGFVRGRAEMPAFGGLVEPGPFGGDADMAVVVANVLAVDRAQALDGVPGIFGFNMNDFCGEFAQIIGAQVVEFQRQGWVADGVAAQRIEGGGQVTARADGLGQVGSFG